MINHRTNGNFKSNSLEPDKPINQEGYRKLHYGVLTTVANLVVPAAPMSWISIVLMVSLIFGGCCANVFALEAIIKEQPSSGPLITFAQFLITALFTLPSFLSLSSGPRSLFLSPRAIPIKSWVKYTAFFVTVNLLNNWAFAYSISVPLHIILRSGGPVASLVIGYFFNQKRYSRGQIMAVAMLSLGVVMAALTDAQTKGKSLEMGSIKADSDLIATATGLSILALAMILSAFQGIYADRLYETYGRSHWKEALFYSHVLSLPIFLPSYPQLLDQWRAMLSSGSLVCPAWQSTRLMPSSSPTINSMPPSLLMIRSIVPSLTERIPKQAAFLLVNALTQYLCIRGVHLLSAQTSSLTVTVILNVRKLVSLLLSIYIFGNDLAPGIILGAVCVFLGGGLYGLESTRFRRPGPKRMD